MKNPKRKNHESSPEYSRTFIYNFLRFVLLFFNRGARANANAVTGEQVLAGGLEAARYGFVAALAIALLFGVPGSVAGPSGEVSEQGGST